jgi:hypothetical protein
MRAIGPLGDLKAAKPRAIVTKSNTCATIPKLQEGLG